MRVIRTSGSGSTIGPESPAMPDFETVRIRAPYDAQAVYRGETRHFSVDETFEVLGYVWIGQKNGVDR